MNVDHQIHFSHLQIALLKIVSTLERRKFNSKRRPCTMLALRRAVFDPPILRANCAIVMSCNYHVSILLRSSFSVT